MVGEILPNLAAIYTDLHSTPELSMQEVNTAAKMASLLSAFGFDVTTGVGKTGVVGVLQNGAGPVVMLRADMDALPVYEENDFPYASKVSVPGSDGKNVPVMHACGHDMHMTCLIGAARVLSSIRTKWNGTLVAVFQPAEETSEGAREMIKDGFFSRFPKPDIILGQHVINTPAGTVNLPLSAATSTGDSIQIRLIGRGSHGAMPENSIDPVVMAASTVLRLQTIVSREVPADEAVVLTIGSLQAGTKENIIPEEAILKVNVRTYNRKIREQVLESIKRIVNAEASASGATTPPEFTTINHFAIVQNDHDSANKLTKAFQKHFSEESVKNLKPTKMSDDFGEFSDASGVPALYWFIGSTDPEIYAKMEAENRLAELPANHNPKFAPLIHHTIELGVQTFIVGALEWLA
jgi:hippurate hydrolase